MEALGKFQIIEKIGEGGMGRVYKALDPILNRKVAIKVIAFAEGVDSSDRTQELRERFTREARLIGSLQHPNIVTLFDYGETEGIVYMAMEFLDGTDLKKVLKSGVALPLPRKLDILKQVCDGLAYAHAQGVIHRDLKPGNIHLLDSGLVKIVDFGLARIGSSDLTKAGVVVGTPYYMSPEQIRGKKVDHRSDIFSLGCVMYEFLTGQRPFVADSMSQLLQTILTSDPVPLRRIAPVLPEALERVSTRCLAKNAEFRYADASTIAAELEMILKQIEERLDTIDRGVRPVSDEISTTKIAVGRPLEPRLDDHALRPTLVTLSTPGGAITSSPTSSFSSLIRGSRIRWERWLAAALLLILAGIGTVLYYRRSSPPPAPVPIEEVPPEPAVVPESGRPPANDVRSEGKAAAGSDARPDAQPAPPPVPLPERHATPPIAGDDVHRPEVKRGSSTTAVPPVAPTPPQPVPQRGELEGTGSLHVHLLNVPDLAPVQIFLNGDTLITDDPSDFTQEDIPAGSHTMTVQSDVCRTSKQVFIIRRDEETTITISLVCD
ncbi:MAG: serine/threonine protein kinase [Acidobacteria bacterium]|nr:serine/threonine protein kinase [Acidobacteriota bacterium]